MVTLTLLDNKRSTLVLEIDHCNKDETITGQKVCFIISIEIITALAKTTCVVSNLFLELKLTYH